MTDNRADHILAAFSALQNLGAAPHGYVGGAPAVLARALDCPWTLILSPDDAAGEAATPNDIVNICHDLTPPNHGGPDHWLGICQGGALGQLHYHGQVCRDGAGNVGAFLFAISPRPFDDSQLAETFMALIAPQVGLSVDQKAGETIGQSRGQSNGETVAAKQHARPMLEDGDNWFRQVVNFSPHRYRPQGT